MICHLCKRDNIPTYSHAYRQVTGYVRDRSGGGANQVTLRTETGRLACSECVDRLKHGISPNQGNLFDG